MWNREDITNQPLSNHQTQEVAKKSSETGFGECATI